MNRKPHHIHHLGIPLMILGALLAACSPAAVAPTPAQGTPAEPAQTALPEPSKPPAAQQVVFSQAVLQNILYTLPDLGKVQLKEGKFSQKYGEGETQVNQVEFLQSILGDLNGDGVDDAAVVLWANTGGSGLYSYLAAVVNQDGKVQPVGAQLLGDRVKVQGLSVKDGKIEIQTLEPGPNDPQCCPSQLVQRTYQVDGNALRLSAEDRQGESASAITGTIWQWESYQDKDVADNIAVNAPGKYTLTLLPDGTYTFIADCNAGSGKVTISGTSIKLEPGAVTLAECAQGSLSSRYLALLGDAATVMFVNGQLVLELMTGGGQMFFSAAG